MTRLGLLASTISLLALGACASPNEGEVAAAAPAAVRAEAVATLEAAPVEASTEALQPAAPVLVQASLEGDAEDALVMPVTYSCSGGRSFIATFPEHGRTVTVAAAGETRVLQHRDGDAALFADTAGAALVAEGAEASLTGLGEGYAGCMAG